MANKRIPELDALTGAATANDDSIVIFDASTNITKRILRSQLAIGMASDLAGSGLENDGTGKLRVTGAFNNGTAGAPSITNTGNTDTGFWFPAADTLAASTAGTERMRIDSAGRAGIATSTPSTNAILTVNGNISVAIPTRNAASANQIGVWTSDDPVDNARAAIAFATVAGGSSSSSYVAFSTNNYGVSGGERMRIDSSGNVGIGTSSPAAKLDVTGTSRVRFGTAAAYVDEIATNAAASAYASKINIAADHQWQISGVEKMRLDSAGNVGIGTNSPGQKLTVAGTIESTSGGVKFPDGTTQTTAAVGSATPDFLFLNAGVI